MPHDQQTRPYLGYGLGLRPDHYQDIVRDWPAVGWFEVLSENYMVDGGKPLHYLERVRSRYPVVMHGVSLSIGGCDPLDRAYLQRLKSLAERIEPQWISDHLCWTGMAGKNLHDLLPLPYTEEALVHVVERVKQVQDFLGRQILLENVSSYVSYADSALSEWEFLRAVTEQADCLILLDINNVYVSSCNHEFDARTYLEGMPRQRVHQFHLAGHSYQDNLIVDTHDTAVTDPVWWLYTDAVRRFGRVSTMIERDGNIPPLSQLLDELELARRIAEPILSERAA
jgi:uncharacterized protein (UPF0276 family)